MINTINSYAHISSATTTQVVTGACTLVAVVVNSTAAGTLTIVDGVSGSTPVVGILASSVAAGTYMYNVTLSTGLRIISGAAGDYTIVYRIH